MIKVYKITERNREGKVLFFLSPNTRKKGHSKKLQSGKFKTDTQKYISTQHVIKPWNSLPQEIVEAKNLAMFKEGWDVYMNNEASQRFKS